MVWFSFGLQHTLKKLSKGALWGINWRQLPLPLDNLLHLSSGKIVTFENLFFYQTFLVEKITVICLEDDVVGLWVAHDEDQIDDEESKKIFGDHPIDHDHKGADNLECPGEKTLVAMRMQEIWWMPWGKVKNDLQKKREYVVVKKTITTARLSWVELWLGKWISQKYAGTFHFEREQEEKDKRSNSSAARRHWIRKIGTMRTWCQKLWFVRQCHFNALQDERKDDDDDDDWRWWWNRCWWCQHQEAGH